MALALDASTLSAWGQSAAGGSASSGSFSPPANAFILLCIGVSGDQVVNTVTNTGTAQTWTRYSKDVNATSGLGDLELWYANTGGSAPGAINVTVSQKAGTHGGTANMYVSVLPIVFTGAETTPGGATSALESGTAFTSTLTITTTRANSYVLGIGYDQTINTARTIGSGQTMIADQGDGAGDEVWAQYVTPHASASGTSTTVNDTAPQMTGAFRAIEIRAAAASTAATATGVLTLTGTAAPSARPTTTGSLNLSGTAAPASRTSATGFLSISGAAASTAPPATGFLTFAGTAAASVSAAATGVLALNGAATAAAAGIASGALTLSAVAAPQLTTVASGNLTLTGSSSTTAVAAATGSLTLTGIVVAAGVGSGFLTFTGTAVTSTAGIASGTLTLSGAAAVYQTPLVSHGDGRVTFVTTGAASSTTANPAAASAAVTTQNAATAATKNLDAWGAITV